MYDRFAMFGDKDITLIGAPTKKGSGTALMYDLAFSITKDCAFPEGAWEFIKYYISAGPGQWENFIEMPQTVYFADGFIPTKETEEEMFTVLDTMVFYFNTTPTRLDNGEEGISLSRWVRNEDQHERADAAYTGQSQWDEQLLSQTAWICPGILQRE